MSVRQYTNVSYGLTQPLNVEAQFPIVTKRNPTTNDFAQVGTIWVNSSSNEYWVLTSLVANSATWTTFGGGGAGVFTSVTVNPGNVTVTAGNVVVTAGSVSAGTTVTAGTGITATTGNITATAGQVDAGTTITAGTGITATTGNITATVGNVVASAGNLVATAGGVSAGTTVVAATGITATTGDINANAGNIVASGALGAGGVNVLAGAGSPQGAITAPQGSLYLNRTGNSTSTRAYINTDGTTNWAAVTTAS